MMSGTWIERYVGMVAVAVLALAAGARAQSAAEIGPQAALRTRWAIVGYADRMGVAPGETIRFMVSSRAARPTGRRSSG